MRIDSLCNSRTVSINSNQSRHGQPLASTHKHFHSTTSASYSKPMFKSSLIYVIARSPQNILQTPNIPQRRGVHDLYRSISPEVLRLISSVQWPSDHALIDIVDSLHDGTLVGASDGSVRTREGRASHTWIIQAPNGSEITGCGPVDGSNAARTSHQAELQGQTALYLILSLLAQYFRILGGKIITYCDIQAVICKL